MTSKEVVDALAWFLYCWFMLMRTPVWSSEWKHQVWKIIDKKYYTSEREVLNNEQRWSKKQTSAVRWDIKQGSSLFWSSLLINAFQVLQKITSLCTIQFDFFLFFFCKNVQSEQKFPILYKTQWTLKSDSSFNFLLVFFRPTSPTTFQLNLDISVHVYSKTRIKTRK